MASWLVRLFGQFECIQGEQPTHLPAASDARGLLAYLFLHKGRAFPRSMLAALIAPDLPEAQARHALSQALWHIRRALPGLLESDINQAGIPDLLDLQVDALEFEALVKPHLVGESQPSVALSDLRRAVELYRSDLLEEFYDDWVLLERERLRELYLQSLERLGIEYKAALQYHQALTITQRLVNADPLNENARREVMRLYHYLGCPAEALRQYEICQDILQREFGLQPEAETTQIAHAISQPLGSTATTYLPEPQGAQDGSLFKLQTDSSLALVGRSAERARLVGWLRQDPIGGGRLILVEGEAGVGKTRLLQEVARDMEWYGSQVLWGRTMPITPSRPLEPLVSALEGGLTRLRVEQLQHLVEPVWLQTLQPLLPGLMQNLTRLDPLADLEGQQAKIRLFEGLFQLLTAWMQINPLVIILEDVHWATGETIEVLAGLASRFENKNVLLVLSYRSEELAGLPEILAKMDAIQPEAVRGRLALAGLDAAAVHELIQASLGAGDTSTSFQEILSRETHGNPLFILEVLRVLYDEGVLRRSETGVWITPYDSAMGEINLPLPPAVEQVIKRRLEQLPSNLRTLLEGLAVLGGEFDFERVSCLGLAKAPQLVSSLQALCRRRLLSESPQAYRFSHDKIRQVMYENLGTSQRIAWHGRLAEALEQAYPDQVEALAHHFAQAQTWEKAVEYHRQSAEKARQANIFVTALEHLNIALGLAEQAQLTAKEQFRLVEMHVEIVSVLGDTQLWHNDLDTMALLAGNDPLRLAKTCQKQIEFLIQTSQYTEAESAARQALSLAKVQDDRVSQAAALNSLGKILDIIGKQQSATECLENAIQLFQQLGDRRGEGEARCYLANVLAKSEQRAAARAEFEAVLALFETINYQPGCADILAVLGVLSEFDENLAASVDYCSRAVEICRSIGYRMGEAYALHGLGSTLLKLGQIGKSLRYFQEALGICLAIGERRIEVVTRIFLSGIYCRSIGDYPAAIHEAEAGLAMARLIEDPAVIGMCLNYLGDAWFRAGDQEEAKTYQELSLEVFQANDCGLRMPDVYLSLANICLSSAQPQEALEKLEQAEALSRKYGLGIYTEPLLSLRAEILLALSRPEEALESINQGLFHVDAVQDKRYRSNFIRYKILTLLGRSVEAYQALEHSYQGLMRILADLTPEQQEISRHNISIHRQILETWQAIQLRRITIRLPRAGAPLGRPLRADEWVAIDWTVAAPEDGAVPEKVDRRRVKLLRLLKEAQCHGAAPTSEHLAQALGVSVRTIAGDLAALEVEHRELLQAALRGRRGKEYHPARDIG